MFVIKSDTPDGAEEFHSKSSKGPLPSSQTVEEILVRLSLTPAVAAPIATLAGEVAPSGLILSEIADAIAIAGVVANLSIPVMQHSAPQVVNQSLASSNPLVSAPKALNTTIFDYLADVNLVAIPISNLSDSNIGQNSALIQSHTEQLASTAIAPIIIAAEQTVIDILTLTNIGQNSALIQLHNEQSTPTSIITPLFITTDHAVIDVTTLQSYSTPVVITALANNAITIIDSASGNVQINNFVAPHATSESFTNTGTGNLTVATDTTHLKSIGLSGNVAFTAAANEATSGITVSGQSDVSNVSLFLIGGANKAQGSSDFITLGNGNDFVFDAGDGQIFINLGNGQDTVSLAGIGVTGVVNLATHAESIADMVAVAANGIGTAQDLSVNALVSIAGLNNDPQSQDVVTFLSDMDAQLAWAGGTGASAHVSTVAGDASSLSNWIGAAQNQASAAHSVAWFQFGGNTYVLESANGSVGNHAGDTLIKLVGLTQFTGNNGEFSIGMLHLAG